MLCEYFVLPWKQIESTLNTTAYMCSTESSFYKYKKISEIGIKLGSFLHFSAQQIFS